jgi:hypothetical protein
LRNNIIFGNGEESIFGERSPEELKKKRQSVGINSRRLFIPEGRKVRKIRETIVNDNN